MSKGYRQAEWVLLDYVDFVIHVFAEKARRYYEFERLWKSAKRLIPPNSKRRETDAKKRTGRPRKRARRK